MKSHLHWDGPFPKTCLLTLRVTFSFRTLDLSMGSQILSDGACLIQGLWIRFIFQVCFFSACVIRWWADLLKDPPKHLPIGGSPVCSLSPGQWKTTFTFQHHEPNSDPFSYTILQNMLLAITLS